MILHIINNSIYTGPFIEFINNNFEKRDHLFFMAKSPDKLRTPEAGNIINRVVSEKRSKNRIAVSLFKTGTYISLFYECLKADKIIIHALYDTSLIKFFYFNKMFLSKSYWAIWGADLYDNKKSKNTWKNNRKEKMKAAVICRLKGIMGVPGDRAIAKDNYDCKAEEFDLMYINALRQEFLNSVKAVRKDHISIQIGNSADPTNGHLEVFEKLSKFKDENIQIFAPLSYGDQENANIVKEAGEKIFGNKFTALKDYLTPEKYSEYLSCIDILIFNHKRQQGLGNIFPLIYTGKKVFIRTETSSWNYFENDLGIKLFGTESIDRMSFAEFISYDLSDREHNIKRAEETAYSEIYLKSIWKNIFNSL